MMLTAEAFDIVAALADPTESGSGAITTMVAMRAATSEREVMALII
jgi:hypothetical protein